MGIGRRHKRETVLGRQGSVLTLNVAGPLHLFSGQPPDRKSILDERRLFARGHVEQIIFEQRQRDCEPAGQGEKPGERAALAQVDQEPVSRMTVCFGLCRPTQRRSTSIRGTRTEWLARKGRNPHTGERIVIGPSPELSFKAGKAGKDALN